ncbi:MAG: hypothetical protein RIC55_02285 [Pirellulaceae bacterium]
MGKRNVTVSYFNKTSGFDGVERRPVPAGIPEHRQAVPRLGGCANEGPADWHSFAETLKRSALPEAVFFLDASFLGRHELPEEIYEVLLSRRIAITPLVWRELQDWDWSAHRRLRDVLVSAKKDGHPSVMFLEPEIWEAPVQSAAKYYTQLLGTRKLAGHILRANFHEKHSRDPTDDELTTLIQKAARDRGHLLAKKGLVDVNKENFYADEELVVLAFFHGVMTGHESVILTGDRDLLEQVYKLTYLIDTDYRSMLVAESYHETPDNVIVHQVSMVDDVFESDQIELLDLPSHFVDFVLPEKHEWVSVQCFRFGGRDKDLKASMHTYCAELDMRRLLYMKGKTEGLNSDLFDGKNIRIALSPPFPDEFFGRAIVAKEKAVRIGAHDISFVDLNYAIMEVEHFRRRETETEESEEAPSFGLLMATFRQPVRLMFTSPPEWMDVPVEEFQTAVRLFNPALFLVDDTFLLSHVADYLADELLERGLATTRHIRDSLPKGDWNSRLHEAVVKGHRQVKTLDVSDNASRSRDFGYYVGLLAFRKLFWKAIKSRVKRDHGRDSPDTEWPEVVERYAGIRGRRLAEEGWRRKDDPRLFFAEELLVQGYLRSVKIGIDVVFLTSDPLFLEQFHRLGRLFRDHYRAYRIGKWFNSNPDSCRVLQSDDDFPSAQLTKGSTYFEIPNDRWNTEILPRRPVTLNLHCWLMGHAEKNTLRFAPFTFCAERPMHYLLAQKAANGLNMSDESGKNVRIEVLRQDWIGVIENEAIIPIGSEDWPGDPRLELGIDGLPKSDLARVVADNCDFPMLWYEES